MTILKDVFIANVGVFCYLLFLMFEIPVEGFLFDSSPIFSFSFFSPGASE